MKKIIPTTLCLSFTLSSCGLLDQISPRKYYHSFNSEANLFIFPDRIDIENRVKVRDMIYEATPKIEKLDNNLRFNDVAKDFYWNYTILNSTYSEYLAKNHCKALTEPYRNRAERSYLKFISLYPNDTSILYNFVIHNARNSQYLDVNLKIEYLEKAQIYIERIKTQYPDQDTAILSDLLHTLNKENLEPNRQKKLRTELAAPLQHLLNNTDSSFKIESGNFIILVKNIYNGLYEDNPSYAKNWVKSNQKKIQSAFNRQFMFNNSSDQRKLLLTALLYTLTDQNQLALKSVEQLDFKSDDTFAPDEIQNYFKYTNLSTDKKFQQWLKQYQNNHVSFLAQYPKQCLISNFNHPQKWVDPTSETHPLEPTPSDHKQETITLGK